MGSGFVYIIRYLLYPLPFIDKGFPLVIGVVLVGDKVYQKVKPGDVAKILAEY